VVLVEEGRETLLELVLPVILQALHHHKEAMAEMVLEVVLILAVVVVEAQMLLEVPEQMLVLEVMVAMEQHQA
jgi:hypothetical protein